MYKNLCWLCISILLTPDHAESVASHSIDEFLAPLENFQIVVRLPEEFFLPSMTTEIAVDRMMDVLRKNEMPVQIYYRFEKWPPASHPSRYVRNQVAWLIITGGHTDMKRIWVESVINSVFKWPSRYDFLGLHRDLMFLIMVTNEGKQPQHVLCNKAVPCFDPHFFVAVRLSFSAPEKSEVSVQWARICGYPERKAAVKFCYQLTFI